MRAAQGPLLALLYVAAAFACVQGAAGLDAASDLTRHGEGARARMQLVAGSPISSLLEAQQSDVLGLFHAVQEHRPGVSCKRWAWAAPFRAVRAPLAAAAAAREVAACQVAAAWEVAELWAVGALAAPHCWVEARRRPRVCPAAMCSTAARLVAAGAC